MIGKGFVGHFTDLLKFAVGLRVGLFAVDTASLTGFVSSAAGIDGDYLLGSVAAFSFISFTTPSADSGVALSFLTTHFHSCHSVGTKDAIGTQVVAVPMSPACCLDSLGGRGVSLSMHHPTNCPFSCFTQYYHLHSGSMHLLNTHHLYLNSSCYPFHLIHHYQRSSSS